MVNTRNSARKERENKHDEASSSQPPSQKPTLMTSEVPKANKLNIEVNNRKLLEWTHILQENSIKSEPQRKVPTSVKSKTSKSKRSTSSSMQARIAKLELQAAEEKAKIQMELIDRRLAANIADLEDEISEHQDEHTNRDVERWLERSQHELEQAQPAHDDGPKKGGLCQPAASCPGTLDGTVQMLACALKDLAATSANTISNANLLSRISTPRDLPVFSGDPMEWLQFKHAYEESSELCNFSPKENLWRIRKCLRGPAKDAVSALLISATEPGKIMATLELQFGNPDSIVLKIMQDIKKLHPMSQDYQKNIITFSTKIQNPGSPISTYAMASLIFGANCSPFIAQFIKNINAQRYESCLPAAVNAIHKQHYMDDYIDSIESETMAIKMIQDIIYIHKQGGFEIRNFTSNNRAVLNSLPKEALRPAAKENESNLRSAQNVSSLPATAPTARPAATECGRAAHSDGITSRYTNLQLHVFCDASTQAMSAVAYWRWTENGRYYVTFIASKCRVAPIQYLSIPRLELSAALLAGRLADTIIEEHKITVCQRYFWCDSNVVLHWIRNNMRNYTTFVAHRLGEIDELTKQNEWRHVPTNLNVADIATREICELSLFKNEWFRGPAFLYEEDSEWPIDKHLPEMQCLNLECKMIIEETKEYLPAVPDPTRFSSWLRLLKTTCNVILFINKCKKLKAQIDGNMKAKAELLLMRYSQLQSFPEDLANLKMKKEIDRKSRLLTLPPFLDEHGILRVGGRINAAPGIPLHVKRPVILDGRNHLARLIVKHYHIKAAHGYNETVVNELKQKYWVIKIRPTVRSVASQCMFCRIRKAQPHPPRMGDLPTARMEYRCRPFTHCGVDLFGPMDITVIRRREKRYGVLFTCLTIRAVHIELVPSLATDSLIMALRRMAARRGWPQFIYSDNGTNLRGADNELKKATLELDQNVTHGQRGSFNAPCLAEMGASG